MKDHTFPTLHRHDWHESHSYTLMVADGVQVRLSAEQLESLRDQIEDDRRPMSEDEQAYLMAQLAEIRAARTT